MIRALMIGAVLACASTAYGETYNKSYRTPNSGVIRPQTFGSCYTQYDKHGKRTGVWCPGTGGGPMRYIPDRR